MKNPPQSRIHEKTSVMSDAPDQTLLEALLDSWDRNNTILLNLLRALPDGGLEVRAMEGSPSVAELFTHVHFVRLVFVFEDAPEFARELPKQEWVAERDPDRIAQMLNDSARAVRDAVKSRVETGRDMDLHYDHPILLLQHMLWHEGYHHGQIKLALKLAGRPITNEEAGPITWRVWMQTRSKLTTSRESTMEIKRVGSQPSAKGPAEWFTGTVRIDPLFQAPDPALVQGASVTFEPGARTAWHTHPLGQTLIVTAGCGWAQRWGGPIEEIRPGDVVWFSPGEKHWHGATPTTAMTHIAIQEKKDGKVVDWMEHVTDEQYRAAK